MNAKEGMVHKVIGFLSLVHHAPWFRGKCLTCNETYEYKTQVMKGKHLMMENRDNQ